MERSFPSSERPVPGVSSRPAPLGRRDRRDKAGQSRTAMPPLSLVVAIPQAAGFALACGYVKGRGYAASLAWHMVLTPPGLVDDTTPLTTASLRSAAAKHEPAPPVLSVVGGSASWRLGGWKPPSQLSLCEPFVPLREAFRPARLTFGGWKPPLQLFLCEPSAALREASRPLG